MRLNALLFIILCCNWGCGNDFNQNYEKQSNYKLTHVTTKELDFPANAFFDYSLIDGKKTLLCIEGNKLSYFDITEQKVYKKDTIFGISNSDARAIRIIDTDLIISVGFFKIYIYNLETSLLKEFIIHPDKTKCSVPPGPNIQGLGNVFKQNNIIYIPGNCYGQNNYKIGDRPTGIIFNIDNKEYNYFMDYPKKYYQYHWGGMYYRDVYMTGNSNKEVLVFSFPASNELYTYDIKTKELTERQGGSNTFKNIIPFSNDLTLPIAKIKEEVTAYYFENYSYASIAYDKTNKLYYRMVEYPNPDYGRENDYSKPRGIIILDEDFTFLGESKLPDIVYSPQIMVTSNEIIIPNFNKKTNKKGYSVFKIEQTKQ